MPDLSRNDRHEKEKVSDDTRGKEWLMVMATAAAVFLFTMFCIAAHYLLTVKLGR
jgi:hypothetical protein